MVIPDSRRFERGNQVGELGRYLMAFSSVTIIACASFAFAHPGTAKTPSSSTSIPADKFHFSISPACASAPPSSAEPILNPVESPRCTIAPTAVQAALAPRESTDAVPGAVSCVTGYWEVNRIDACGVAETSLNVVDEKTGELIGQLLFTATDKFELSPSSRTFAENIKMDFYDGWGQIAGLTATLHVSCGGTCKAVNHLAPNEPVRIGTVLTGAISYEDSTTKKDLTHTSYSLTPGPGSLKPATWHSIDYRCDDELSRSAGCVFPEYYPQLTTIAKLKEINANIHSVQTNGPHHYGRYAAKSGYPLHRNSALQDANNAKACPAPGPRPTGTSCDEYPFATTDEGASKTRKPDWGSAWVAVSEQNQQGGLLNSFYLQNRILDGDAYWVYST